MDELPSLRRWGLRKQEGHELSADVTASLHAGIPVLVVIRAGPGVPSGSSRLQGGSEVRKCRELSLHALAARFAVY